MFLFLLRMIHAHARLGEQLRVLSASSLQFQTQFLRLCILYVIMWLL